MEFNIRSDIRLDVKSALGIITLFTDDDEALFYWNNQKFHSKNITPEDITVRLWNKLYGGGTNENIITSIKRTQEPLDFLGRLGERDYWKLSKGGKALVYGRENALSRWASNSGLNVGKSDLLTLQYTIAKRYLEGGEELFQKEVETFIDGDYSLLNAPKSPYNKRSKSVKATVKIGGQDYPLLSGGPYLGAMKNSLYSIHPIKFLLAMEALSELSFKIVNRIEEGENTPELRFLLEFPAHSAMVNSDDNGLGLSSGAFTLEWGDFTIFPLWSKETNAKELLNALHDETMYFDRDNKNGRKNCNRLEEITKVTPFNSYSIFITTDVDSQNKFTYCLKQNNHGGESLLAKIDNNISGGGIARSTGYSSFDEYLKSTWAATKHDTTLRGRIRGTYMNFNKLTKANRELQLPIIEKILDHIDDESAEFSLAIDTVLLTYRNEIFDSINVRENILEHLINNNFSELMRKYFNGGVNGNAVKSLEYGLGVLDIEKIENLITILWILPYTTLKDYRYKHYNNLVNRPVMNGAEIIKLSGLPFRKE